MQARLMDFSFFNPPKCERGCLSDKSALLACSLAVSNEEIRHLESSVCGRHLHVPCVWALHTVSKWPVRTPY